MYACSYCERRRSPKTTSSSWAPVFARDAWRTSPARAINSRFPDRFVIGDGISRFFTTFRRASGINGSWLALHRVTIRRVYRTSVRDDVANSTIWSTSMRFIAWQRAKAARLNVRIEPSVIAGFSYSRWNNIWTLYEVHLLEHRKWEIVKKATILGEEWKGTRETDYFVDRNDKSVLRSISSFFLFFFQTRLYISHTYTYAILDNDIMPLVMMLGGK